MLKIKNNLEFSKQILVGLFFCVTILTFINIFNSNHDLFSFSPGVAHAQTIYDGLTNRNPETNWIFSGGRSGLGVWNIMRGLANAFVAVILFFFAFVNIAHIEYDTYQLKKSLPKLILGIIMANFSMVICRLMLSIANVITVTFVQDTGELARGIMTAVCFKPDGTGFAQGFMSNGGGILVAVVFGLFIVIGIFVVAFLVWIRRTVIYLLAAVSPIAFVMLAFPPTESYFKSWWDWEIKWTFMGSISIFLIWLASQIGAGQCPTPAPAEGGFQISNLLAVVGLLILAGIVPFKLGGAVTNAWAGAAKGIGNAAWNNPYSQRKRDLVKAHLADKWGGSALGRLANRGKVADEMHLENYKQRAANRDTDAKTDINKKYQGFQETKHETEMANSRLETQEAITMDVILNGKAGNSAATRAAEMAAEKLRNLNAKNDVEKTNTNAETKARADAGHEQNLKERELAHAKNVLEEEKVKRDEDINEGILGNMTQQQIESITGLKGADATGMGVKSKYLEQANKLNTQKLRAEKRAGQDAQALAQRDLRKNDEFRQMMKDLEKTGDGIKSDINLNGDAIQPDPTTGVVTPIDLNWSVATETAEQLRYRATTAEGAEKTRLENAANHFDQLASKYEDNLKTNGATIATKFDSQATNFDADAANAEATLRATTPGATAAQVAAARAPHEAKAKTARKVASELRSGVNFKNYLTNNLAGRRQKIINPDIADEIQTQVKSTPAEDLYGDLMDPTKTVGTGEARIGQKGMFSVLNGRMSDVSEPEARAGLVQVGAMHSVMTTARHGDVTGLNQMDGFFKLMNAAGRTEFKKSAVTQAYASMDAESQNHIAKAALEQANIPIPQGETVNTVWAKMSDAEKQTHLGNIQFEKLNTKGGGAGPSALGNFVDRTLGRVEADKGLGLGSSSGSKAAKTRGIDSADFIESQPLPPLTAPTPPTPPSPSPIINPQTGQPFGTP